jgi:cbb3-type cytochrome oxidase cytochrome c subunit
MNYGPLLFLGAFFALCASWFGLVLSPNLQIGHLQQTNSVPIGLPYPVRRAGLASQGLDIYRANGCAYCHSQQVGQTGVLGDVRLIQPGTNQVAFWAVARSVLTNLSEGDLRQLPTALPKSVFRSNSRAQADDVVKALSVYGAKVELWIMPTGPDIARGWGIRRTVAEDFLYDYPVQPGSQRVGPDLANVGMRWDANWQMQHLYNPKYKVPESVMPPYHFLFEKRRKGSVPSADALPSELSPSPEFEIVPKQEAKALVAYLTSLRADAPLFDAPVSTATPPPAADTNAPAGPQGVTNAPSTNSPAK